MGEKNLSHKAMEIHMEGAIQKALDIFETDDGRTFEEKKKAVYHALPNIYRKVEWSFNSPGIRGNCLV